MAHINMERLNVHSFFSHYIIDPLAKNLTRDEKIAAVFFSVTAAIFTLGIAHLIAGISWWKSKKMVPLTHTDPKFTNGNKIIHTTEAAKISTRTHQISNDRNLFNLPINKNQLKTPYLRLTSQEMGALKRENFADIMQREFIDACYAKPLPKNEDVTVFHPDTNEIVPWSTLTIPQKVKVNNKYAHPHNQISDPEYPCIDNHFFGDGQAPYLPNDPRHHHGSDHSVRASIFAAVFAMLYNKYYPGARLSKAEILLAQCVAAGHDSGRQTEGVDVHDEDSAKKTVEILQKLGVNNKTILNECKKAIAEKDSIKWNEKSMLGRCVQNADCAEFARLLLKGEQQDDLGFKNSRNYLDIYRELKEIAEQKKVEQQVDDINSVVLKHNLTFHDFLFELDHIREEMNAFIYTTHKKESRKVVASTGQNYYAEILKQMTSVQCPRMNELLISCGVIYNEEKEFPVILAENINDLIQQIGDIKKLNTKQLSSILDTTESIKDFEPVKSLYTQLYNEQSQRTEQKQKFQHFLTIGNNDNSLFKTPLLGNDLANAYLALSSEEKQIQKVNLHLALGINENDNILDVRQNLHFLDSKYRDAICVEIIHTQLRNLIDLGVKQSHLWIPQVQHTHATELRNRSNALLLELDNLLPQYFDDSIQTTASLAFAQASSIFMTLSLHSQAIDTLQEAGSKIKLHQSHLLYDLDKLMKENNPPSFLLRDSNFIRKRRMRLQKILIDNTPFYEISFELPYSVRNALEMNFELLKKNPSKYITETVPCTYYKKAPGSQTHSTKECVNIGTDLKVTLADSKNSPEVFIGNNKTYHNQYHTVRIRLNIDSTGQDLHNICSQIGLPMCIMPSRTEDIQREMIGRSMAFRYPQLIYANPHQKNNIDITYAHLTVDQKKLIDDDCNNMRLTKVGRNQFELVQPSIGEEAWKNGIGSLVSFINAGTTLQTANVLVNILNTGLLSSSERFKQGILGLGCAPTYNFQTGSGGQVFARSLPKSLFKDNYPLSNFAIKGPILLLLDVQALERMPYSYTKDRGGVRNPNYQQNKFDPEGQQPEYNYRGYDKIKERLGFQDYIQAIQKEPHPLAETMFDETLSASYIQKIVVANENDRKIVIDTLERAKIYKINGLSLQEAICSTYLDQSMIDHFDSKELPKRENHYERPYL